MLTGTQPIFLRAAHSPWPGVSQPVLIGIRMVLSGYLTAVLGVALKYKLELEQPQSKWHILFQFATVSFLMLWAWNVLLTVCILATCRCHPILYLYPDE